MPAGDTFNAGTDDAFDVDAVMLIKAFVLNGNKGVGQIFGYHIHSHGDSVGILRNQFGRLIPFNIVYEGGEAGRLYIDIADFRCSVDDATE